MAARVIQGSAVPADNIAVLTDACATSHVVASELGHSSPPVTHAHYIDGTTTRRARTRRVVGKGDSNPHGVTH